MNKIKLPVKIGCGTLLALLAVGVIFFLLPSDYEEPPPNPIGNLHVANVKGVTPDDGGGYKYDDGELSLVLTASDEAELEAEIASAERVLTGKSGSKGWTSVTDSSGNEKIYISSGGETVKASVISKPEGQGAEKAASKAAALVDKRSAYSERTRDWDESAATRYLELADCVLYYPAQLSRVMEYEDSTLELSDPRSSARLKITYEPNPYTSMDEVEGFIESSENDRILAYGPAWYSAEYFDGANTVYTFAGLGENYIVYAELTYETRHHFVFGELRELIKCKFVGDGGWKSDEKASGYYDESSLYGAKFSRDTVAYYCEELKVILLYPEMFSHKGDVGDTYYVSFLDPRSGAAIGLERLSEDVTVKSLAESGLYTDVNAVDEHSAVCENPDAGVYAYAYFGTESVLATVNYPVEYTWVYEELLAEIKVVPAEDFYDNTELREIVYSDIGARVTLPLQFEELGFYGGVASFEDSSTGIALSVTFEEIHDNSQKEDIFLCFNILAEDGDLTLGENHVSWMNNDGYFYGARGNYSLALLEIHAPNAPTVYRSVLGQIKVEFVSELERVKTEDELMLELEAPPETEPPETEPITEPPETEPITEAPETTEKPKPPAAEAPELPLIMAAGLGDLVSDPESPLIELLMSIDASQITKGDLNIFRLVGYGDDITDEEIDLITDTTQKLVELGFKSFTEEIIYYRSYVFYGELNGKDYVVGFSFEYDNDSFYFDEEFNYIYDGPGERLYMTIITRDDTPDPGDVMLDYDFDLRDSDGNPDFRFNMLYRTAFVQRRVAEELKRTGGFYPELVFMISRAAIVYEDMDYEDFHLEFVDDMSYDQLIISYGMYDSLGIFTPHGRMIYNIYDNPVELDSSNTFEYDEPYGDDRSQAIWMPEDEVAEIYDFWSEKAELDSFFDELEAELFADYDDYIASLDEWPSIYD